MRTKTKPKKGYLIMNSLTVAREMSILIQQMSKLDGVNGTKRNAVSFANVKFTLIQFTKSQVRIGSKQLKKFKLEHHNKFDRMLKNISQNLVELNQQGNKDNKP